MEQRFTGNFIKMDTDITGKNLIDQAKYKHFIEGLPKGSIIEVYMEYQTDDGTLTQLAKIHAMIRELASHIGETFEDMKLVIKRRAGLCIVREIEGEQYIECKSLGRCSKKELALCIEAIKEISVMIDHPLQ